MPGIEIHLVEPSGYAGVFQHACALGEGLARSGHRVVLHTAHQHEPVRLDGVALCTCTWWPRRGRSGRVRLVRQAAVAALFAARTLPHLHRAVPPGAVLHLQGIAAAGALNLLALRVAGLRGRRAVYSPHDTFSRRGRVDGALLRRAEQVAYAVVVFSAADADVLHARGVPSRISPLVQLVPSSPTEEARTEWRRQWGAGPDEAVVLFAGFIRPEKRLDMLVEAARSWPPGRRLAVVGEDFGGWARCAALAVARRVDVAAHLGFVGLDEFAAALAAADLVVVPSERASQSGVLALARELGVPTVAAAVGGMAELATRTFASGDPAALNRAIDAELATIGRITAPGSVRTGEDRAVLAHVRAYGATP